MCIGFFSSYPKIRNAGLCIHGISVASGASVVSHLFFVDDIILFTKETRDEVDEVKIIIEKYEAVSG